MSVVNKALEKIFSGQQLYEMDRLLENIKAQARNNTSTAIEQARTESERRINQERQASMAREQANINRLSADTANKLAQQDARHRQALLERTTALHTAIKEQEVAFKNDLAQAQAKNQKDVADLRKDTHENINNLRHATNAAIRNVESNMRKAFDQQNEINRRHNEEIHNVRADVSALQGAIAVSQESARHLSEHCQRTAAEYDNDITVVRFQNEELQRIKTRIDTAATLIDANAQAAVGMLTEARLQLMEIKEQASVSQVIFETIHQNALSEVKALLQQIDNNKSNTKINETSVDLDFWTHGEYKKLIERVKVLEQKLDGAHSDKSMDIHEIQNLLEEVMVLEKQEENLVVTAVQNIQLSDNCNTTASEIIDGLLSSGNFDVVDEGYVAGDIREGYYATLKDNHTQNSITITADSLRKDGQLKSMVNVQRNDENDVSMAYMEAQIEMVGDILGQESCESVKRINVEDEKIYDAEALKRTKLTRDQKQRLGKL